MWSCGCRRQSFPFDCWCVAASYHTHIFTHIYISMISAHAFAAAIVALMPDLIQVTFSHHFTPHHRALSTLTLSLAHDLRVQLGGRHFLRLSGSSRSVGLPGISRAASGRRHGAAAACTHPRPAAGNTLSGAASFRRQLPSCLSRACGAGLIFSLNFQVMSGASAAAAAVPSYSAMGSSQSWDRKAFRSGTLANTSS